MSATTALTVENRGVSTRGIVISQTTTSPFSRLLASDRLRTTLAAGLRRYHCTKSVWFLYKQAVL